MPWFGLITLLDLLYLNKPSEQMLSVNVNRGLRHFDDARTARVSGQ